MILTLQEIMDTCPNWAAFCELKGFSEYAVNEGGGDVQVTLTTQEAHQLGIVKLPDWKAQRTEKATVKYGCHCDLETMPEGFEPDGCVMDDNMDADCVYAVQLRRAGKGKTACEYWQPIKFKARTAG